MITSLIISCFFGAVIGVMHGLSLTYGSRKAFSSQVRHNPDEAWTTSAKTNHDESPSRATIAAGTLYPLARLIILFACLYGISKITMVNIPIALVAFFITSWSTIIWNAYRN